MLPNRTWGVTVRSEYDDDLMLSQSADLNLTAKGDLGATVTSTIIKEPNEGTSFWKMVFIYHSWIICIKEHLSYSVGAFLRHLLLDFPSVCHPSLISSISLVSIHKCYFLDSMRWFPQGFKSGNFKPLAACQPRYLCQITHGGSTCQTLLIFIFSVCSSLPWGSLFGYTLLTRSLLCLCLL